MNFCYLIRSFISPSVSLAILEYKFQVPSFMGYKTNRGPKGEYSKALLESREVNEAYSDETIPVHSMTPNSLCGNEIMHT